MEESGLQAPTTKSSVLFFDKVGPGGHRKVWQAQEEIIASEDLLGGVPADTKDPSDMVVPPTLYAAAAFYSRWRPSIGCARLRRVPFSRGVIRFGALTCILVVTGEGCMNTKLPSILPTPAEADRRSFTVHDPLPETDIGPDTFSRPRGFTDEWAEPRRTLAAQSQLGMDRSPSGQLPSGQTTVPGASPNAAPNGAAAPSSQAYPDAVPQ